MSFCCMAIQTPAGGRCLGTGQWSLEWVRVDSGRNFPGKSEVEDEGGHDVGSLDEFRIMPSCRRKTRATQTTST